MLLTVDIGNTNISFGVFKDKKLVRRFEISTKVIHNRRGGLNLSCGDLKRNLGRLNIEDAIICSVVPEATKVVKGALRRLGIRAYIIGKDIKAPIVNLYRKPAQVGQDRLVNAYAGIKLYGAPLIIVDFGTAITFDVISKDEEYLGGMILPGLRISLEALREKTALLPAVELKEPDEFIGGDTRNSMLSGIVYGFAALTDNLTEKIKETIGRNALVVGAGGNINLIKKYCRNFDKININLTIEGLSLLAKNNKKNT